jgi:hypothetical protein
MRSAWLTLLIILGSTTLSLADPAELYFAEDFEEGGSEPFFFEGTLDQRRFSYVEGRYEIDTSTVEAYGQSVLLEDLASYRVEVTGQLLETADPDGGGFGLSLNYREREGGGADFLLFLVYDRGAYTVLRYLEGRTGVLYSPTKTGLFRPGEAVTLTADVDRGQLTCYVNGAEVARLREERLGGGGFGMFATARSVARFDNFAVYAEQPAEVLPVEDDFAGERVLSEGTWGDVTYEYADGRYVIDTSATEYIGLSPFPEEALSFELAVDVELLDGEPTGGYGIYLRDYEADGGFNQFRFLISGAWFAVEQSVGDRPLALAQWTQHAAVRDTGVNRLRVRALGEELLFFVNGVEVYRYTDEHPHSGAYGFFASGGIRVSFDDFSMTTL